MISVLDRKSVDSLCLKMLGFDPHPVSLQGIITRVNDQEESNLQRAMLIRNGKR